MAGGPKGLLNRVVAPFVEIFGLSRAVALLTVLLILAMVLFAVFWFFHSAPPRQITITSGSSGSSLESFALSYQRILKRNGVTLNVLRSEGSLENRKRLEDPLSDADIGFVQGGLTNGASQTRLVSLGSIAYEPLVVFYRGTNRLTQLSELKGKRLAIGPVGSGTRLLALTLLHLNDIAEGEGTVFEALEAKPAALALLSGSVDAAFLMGDSASPQLMKQLLLAPGVELLDFTQADAYCRRVSYLNKLTLPKGSIDFARNIPAQDISLIAPTVELLARPHLHPALCDLLIEAGQEVHGKAGLLKKKGEFPAPLEHEYPINSEATRFYKSGKSFLYRWLPFWLAGLVNRILVAFVPVIVLLVPGIRALPTVLGLRVKLRLYRWYRALLEVERIAHSSLREERTHLLTRLDHIEREVNRMRVPASFADQFYALRGSIGFVRERLASGLSAEKPPAAEPPS
jgi:TRAP-type uncharacterized transport system substrate-binding protein